MTLSLLGENHMDGYSQFMELKIINSLMDKNKISVVLDVWYLIKFLDKVNQTKGIKVKIATNWDDSWDWDFAKGI